MSTKRQRELDPGTSHWKLTRRIVPVDPFDDEDYCHEDYRNCTETWESREIARLQRELKVTKKVLHKRAHVERGELAE